MSDALSQIDKNILDHYTNLMVGDVLRKAREAAGYNLSAIATSLNIATAHLQAIEANDAGRLPEPVYAVGFVKAYADYLGLDKDKIVYLFKRQVLGQMPQRANVRMPRIQQTHILPPRVVVVLASTVLVLLFGLGWYFNRGTDEPVVAVVTDDMREDKALPQEKPAPAPEEKPAALPQPEKVTAMGKEFGASAAESRLMIVAKDAAWIEIRERANSKSVLFNRVLKAGEAYHAPLSPALKMNTGKAEHLEIMVDGAPIPALKGKIGVVKDLPLPNTGSVKPAGAQ